MYCFLVLKLNTTLELNTMSNFRDLSVYNKARALNKDVFMMLRDTKFDRNIRDQLSRASTSILLNIAEGSGRFTKRDKRHFFIIARASGLECMALIDVIEDLELLLSEESEVFRLRYTEISKMLFGMIRNLE
jgi:four helix bundle protein